MENRNLHNKAYYGWSFAYQESTEDNENFHRDLVEEIRLRALLSTRCHDNKYTRSIPRELHFVALYPEILGLSEDERKDEERKMNELKEKIDKQYES